MRKTVWIIAAAVLTAVGIGLFVFAVLFFKFDFKSGYPFISKEEMPTMKCVIAETPGAADRIEVRLNTSGLTLRPSEDGRCRAEYTELPDVKLSFTLENGTLRVVETDERPWYRRLFWSPKQTVTLYLPPEHSYERLSVNGTTGDVSVDDSFRFGSVSVQVGTGDVRFGKTVSETSFEVSTTTGDIRIAGLNA
ncbi:MAG: DUF4097 family beta strand repeat protein, partial [Clostridia bacterium]|nr:DUF4097 family beta strand repeat protein [Clostridia bacterium]